MSRRKNSNLEMLFYMPRKLDWISYNSKIKNELVHWTIQDFIMYILIRRLRRERFMCGVGVVGDDKMTKWAAIKTVGLLWPD